MSEGIFGFSDGFHRPAGAEGHTLFPVDDGAMLSEMFNYHSTAVGPSAELDLLAAQIPYRPPTRPAAAAAPLSVSGDHNWYGGNQLQGVVLGAYNSLSSLGDHHEAGGGSTDHGASYHDASIQGLSLTLSSSLHPLERAKAEEEQRLRDGLQYFSSHHHGQLNQGQQMGMAVNHNSQLRNSKYARAAQELLEEFCSAGRGQLISKGSKIPNPNPNNPKDRPALPPAERFEHQRKKAKLLSMLDEVERRYSHYCEQMKGVVNSFDSALGFGAAKPYTSLAQRAMSRHFRCLKDAIVEQLRQTCELLGEKEGGSGGGGGSGITKGETPRLRLLDRSLRQQRAFHQMGMMEQEAWRPQRGLPDRSVTVLRAWLFEHFLHPYPSDADKHLLSRQTGLSRNQVSNWFINARVRLWKPMVEEMYQKEAKEDAEELQAEDGAQSPTSQSQLRIPKKNTPESDLSPTVPNRFNATEIQRLPTVVTHDDAILDGIYGPADSLFGNAMGAEAAGMRFGTTGDVSLTLGLQHSGNTLEKSWCKIREFGDR